MRHISFYDRFKATALSLVITAAAVAPAAMNYTTGMITADAVVSDAATAATLGTITNKETYTGYIADLAASGVKTITLNCTADYTGNFSYGFGIGIKDDPYWME